MDRPWRSELTKIIFAVSWFPKLFSKGVKRLWCRSQEADTLHVSHPIALMVVYSVYEVDLVRK
jgi:hypothetical protein